MKSANLVKTLMELGLTDNEAEVYLAALSLGSTTVLQIARKSKVKRTTVYSIIESLKSKGLITIQILGFKKRYLAEDPDKLKEILELRNKKLQESLPILNSLQKLKTTEGVLKYYEGLPAIKSIYNSLLEELEENDEYYVIANQEFWYDLDPDYFQKFIEKRAQIAKKKHIKIKLLFQDSSITRKHKKQEKEFEEVIKILPKHIVIDADLVITPHKLIIHQVKGQDIAIVIENTSIIDTHKQIFNILWKLI